ncbi:MAG: hypothetical protein QXU99_03635 [Candidatus Bathyarchaeia archaeon]
MFGLVLGMQESMYRAAVCKFIPLCKRGTTYGVFNTILGVGTLASGVIFGFLLDYGYSWIVLAGLVLLLQVGAIVTLNRARISFQTSANPSI